MDADASMLLDYYARRAAEYEEIYQKPERQADLSALKAHVQQLMAGHDVLEIACGTGYWTEVLAPVCQSVLATDVNEEVLQVAQAKSYTGASVRFRQADAYNPGYFPGPFSAAFAGFWWSHVPRERLAAFLERLRGRLVPEARACFIDNRFVEGSSTPIAYTDAHGNTYQRRRLKDGFDYEVIKNFPSPEALLRSISPRASEVEVVEFTYYWSLSYRC